jgi:hypothetical protein
VPDIEVFEDSFDNTGIVDECDDAQVATAVDTLERFDLLDLLQAYARMFACPFHASI